MPKQVQHDDEGSGIHPPLPEQGRVGRNHFVAVLACTTGSSTALWPRSMLTVAF
jgi:hypothetical protein